MCHHLLFDFSALTHRAHESPIGVNLATLLDRRVPQIHAVNSGMEIWRFVEMRAGIKLRVVDTLWQA